MEKLKNLTRPGIIPLEKVSRKQLESCEKPQLRIIGSFHVSVQKVEYLLTRNETAR